MTVPPPKSADNRRVMARIMTHEVLRGLATMARVGGGDMIQFLVFSGIWSANTQHLLGIKVRSPSRTTSRPTASAGPSRRRI
ncbi:hypothetical protein [Phenylobacterium sp.]|uniref:hypothetical protein n=1 Tax=Phenylobacterium sp. TaxID=1871053 RepID=UPI002720A497|nr:hypothetical protein [Phenylobacterium sp.]MDO8380453.1 hypothetical protein [Phenylobacterium sp.]